METQGKKRAVYTFIHITLTALAAVAVELFLLLSLSFFRAEWGNSLWLFLVIGGSVLNAVILATDVFAYFKGKELIYKACITLYVMLVCFGALAYALIATGFFAVVRDGASLQAYLERSGGWMGFLFTTLQFLQVVVLPIPSTVTVVAGAALFGPLYGSLLSLLGILIGSLVAFLVGRYAGTRVVAWLVGKETLEKWLKKIKGKDKLLLTAMFLLPVFPDDVLCFIAGISSMSLGYFLAVILISRILAIFVTSYSITLIPFNTWWGLLIWAILLALVIALFILLYKKSDAILGWFEKKFHRETRIETKPVKGEFSMEVIGPDGAIVTKGVKKEGGEGE
ncbi:MAG: TVP38/TMEM64 family protein [Clostridia bacterium]|nr:TVP38/TMEM64 family protein [Clostridia bacterium]